MNSADARKPQRKGAGTAEQIGNAFGFADMGKHQLGHGVFRLLRRLRETAGRW
ncbi:hypothetical protein D3C78_1909880 [compost metagenome]